MVLKLQHHLKENNPEFLKILTKIKVKFKFTDKDVVLENKGELIELDEKNNFKQIRFSTRLDYVPPLEKNTIRSLLQSKKKNI